MARQAERLAATRGAILRAASDLFGREGYAATTVDEVAAAAGVAKGAVYHHFATKGRLFETVLEAATTDLAVEVAKRAALAADVWDAIAVATEAYFALASTGAAARIVLGDGPAVLGWERWREIDAEHFGRAIPAILEAAMRAGLIATQPIAPLARLLLGAATEAAAACAASATPAETGGSSRRGISRLARRATYQGKRLNVFRFVCPASGCAGNGNSDGPEKLPASGSCPAHCERKVSANGSPTVRDPSRKFARFSRFPPIACLPA